MKKLVIVLIVLLVGTVWAGTYSGGFGIGKSPYLISNTDDWQELIDTPTDWGKGFILTSDIDFGGQTITPVAADTSNAYGFQGTKFTGVLNGKGFSIKNAVIDRSTNNFVGLLGFVGAAGQVLNLGAKNVSVTGESSVGILVGENEGTIKGCFTIGTINAGGDYAGGLVGYNSGTISLSCSKAILNGTGWHNGGLVGFNMNGSILNCYAAGQVSGTGNVFGGLVGTNGTSTITNCYASCWIGNAASRGGLIGSSSTGTITSSYWDKIISTLSVSAGGTGKTTAQMKQQATFSGWDFNAVDSIWQITEGVSCPRLVSLLPAYSGGTGVSDGPYQISTIADWLELVRSASDYSNYFRMTGDIDFKGLTITPVAANTLSLDRTRFTGIFDGGGFAVGNAAINNPLENIVGLFGIVGSSGAISNLVVENISVTGRQYVGGLAGYNQGQISQCSVTGTVDATNFYVGGLVGWQENLVHKCFANVDVSTTSGYYLGGLVGGNSNGTITQCYATGDVNNLSQYAGGLVGYNGGTTSSIQNCYATGSVSASHISGGLVGGNVCAISYCYSTGFVSGGTVNDGGLVGVQTSPGTTISSYWDKETSGKITSASGIGKTTVQMKQAATFTSWDFANIWTMLADNYPSLIWSVEGLTTDLDGNGTINMVDLALFVGHWLDKGCQFPDWCSGCDLNASGNVDFVDYAIFADNIEVTPIPITWVYISDPGVEGHEGFTGEMSKYETTNAQYCQYLNAAKASGAVTVSGNYVVGASGPYSGQNYYDLAGSGWNYDGATNGGAARINWTGSSFTVDSGFENHPVTYVSWYGSTAFASYYGWRLPTEWEWQAVADYNGSYTYGCGTTINNSIANYYGSTHPYGTTAVGAYGTYGYSMADMAGNVWEWTSSLWEPAYSYRVLRGGSWSGFDYYCSVSYRNYYCFPDLMGYLIGFRVCRGDLQPDITWVSIDDPGVEGHEGFIGEMSKYETTNAQYCHFLNTALASGDITVGADNIVYGANGLNPGGDFVSEVYYNIAGSGVTGYGATNGGAARINWTGSSFTVNSGFENHPVTYVSWYGATAYAGYYGWRLPTGWEWEAVADYDGSYTYGCGTSINNNIANYLGSTHPDGTTVVGAFGTYGYGMADMAGNVFELTSTIVGRSNWCVIRGGSWPDEEVIVDIYTSTYLNGQSLTGDRYGFRVCRGDLQPDITWVSIDDPGVTGHEGFTGEMSKYETTNYQYCKFLNNALASGDVVIDGNNVKGANGSNSGEDFVDVMYYNLAGSGITWYRAINGGAARINWTGSSFTVDSGFENHPVTYVNWYGSTAFASYYGWRLPTEWEWQAVADYNGTYRYGCGTTINNSMANYWGSIHPYGTTAVGSYGTYGYSMADMAGNVYEWTDSCFYSDCADGYRVLRGGGWSGSDGYCSVSNCDYDGPDLMYLSYGFRVCR